MTTLMSREALTRSLNLPDLTNPHHGDHAMQQLLTEIRQALAAQWPCRQQLVRTSPAVPVCDNYDRLGYPADGAAREARYTRYITPNLMLRTQTSAAIPDLLEGLSIDPPQDLLLVLPGLVYRRDSIDRLHCGEPHQLDLWRLIAPSATAPATTKTLLEMITLAMHAALPGVAWRTKPSPHPYTEEGVQIDAYWQDSWIEVGECGLANRRLLANAGLTDYSGLAMGLGLDRLLMVRKGIDDIRLLRSEDPRIRRQMNTLAPYQPVSAMPAIQRDLSLCVADWDDPETLGDHLRSNLPQADLIEALEVLSETAYDALPETAHRRMGMSQGQKNILLRLTLRHMTKTLTDNEANDLRNQVYRLLHQGHHQEIAHNGL